MTVNKLERFAEVAEFDHVIEHTDFQNGGTAKPKGMWNKDIFGNQNPITLELACGTGAYTLELARRNPNRNYIGIDIKGARIWKGAKQAKAESLDNVRFLRIFIDHLDEYFAENEIDEIWITFADPFPRAGDRSNRLTSPKFLRLYKYVLPIAGNVHFKTDDKNFFRYTCQMVTQFGGSILEKVEDIYLKQPENKFLTIKTTFEKKHLQNGKMISYCKFSFF
jgi:tRNA (guanine-N7-)-methyltransferase